MTGDPSEQLLSSSKRLNLHFLGAIWTRPGGGVEFNDVDRKKSDVFRSDQRAARTQKAHEHEFVGFSAISW